MGLTFGRDLVALYKALSSAGLRFFGRGTDVALQQRPEYSALLAAAPKTPAELVLSFLQAMTVFEQELQPRMIHAEFVATLPSTAATEVARPIHIVVAEMLAGANKEIIAVGYEFEDVSFIAALAKAARLGVPVTLIRDRQRSLASKFSQVWPEGVPTPTIFQDRERPDAAKFAKMHGKALLVDGLDLLVSSANFTFHGMHGNVEFGVRLRGAAAGRAGDVFRVLERSGLLEKCE
jgi:phosphatidylserine/phosphatidylglycerophosphate/cardiolipin synthase-like enzyme